MGKKTFAVIGIGRFGQAVVEELIARKADVLVIDKDPERIARVSKIATHAVVLDTADKGALKEVGIQSIDHVIVAIGNDIENSILTTLILKELGVETVTVKVQNEYHAKVVEKLGADELVQPEQQTGKRLANKILSKNILEYYDLSKDHSFIVLEATSKITDSRIINLDVRTKYHINIVAIKRGETIVIPKPEDVVMENDKLILVGKNVDLEKYNSWLIK
ncbi:potassium transporter Trk [Candidatus Izimaplasma bacterium ZiA1]|uniref:potassium channel family protein n=1 Tax=Candidatus Izimoplasma sp. ZiA1 TaxID=2024899 RepID=UPI000BAA6636|nr:potassium transporter Trk [Candidatus Izimaplasma bacterium ZiA1]